MWVIKRTQSLRYVFALRYTSESKYDREDFVRR